MSADKYPSIFSRQMKAIVYILNLKKLNKHIAHIQFKIDTLQSCINLMKKNCYMGSLDLSDAYYSISISPESQKYLKFRVGHQLNTLITLPNGLNFAPRIFTKLMKPVYSTLRTRGHISSGYLDDSFLLGDLGFNVSGEKSITHPTQVIEHVGFVLNSVNMTLTLPKEKLM